MNKVLNVLIAHQEPELVQRLVAYWSHIADDRLIVAHGGAETSFAGLAYTPKIFVDDPRLRTRDHQRELQSITGIFRAIHQWLASTGSDYEFIYLAEFDHLPLVRDLNARQVDLLRRERADVLAFALRRVDGTSYAHYLYHAANPSFHAYFAGITVRDDANVVLSMIGTGSFWTRQAFSAVAAADEPFPMYSELFVPTLAHHLGFRLRDYGPQERFVSALGERSSEINSAAAQGGWALHPVKNIGAFPAEPPA